MLSKTQILFVFGFVVLSPWSSKITLDYLHLPLSLPEIFFLVFIPFFKKNYYFKNPFHLKSFYGLFLVWCLLLVLGIMHSSPVPIISTSRTWLYILIFYALFCRWNSLSIRDCYIISVGSIVGWLSVSIINLKISLLISKDLITYGPMLAVPISICYPIINNRKIQVLSILLLSMLIGFTAGLRRELVVVLISFITCYLIFWGQNFNKLLKICSICFFIVISFAPIYNDISLIIKDETPFIYYRIIDKTEKLVSGNANEGDSHRKQLINSAFFEFDKYLIPNGFINKQYDRNGNNTDVNGDFNDLPILELNKMLGFPISALIILFFVSAVFRVLRRINRKELSKDHIVLVVGGVIMFLLLFLEGSFLTYPYCAPFTGFFLGKLKLESKIILNTKKQGMIF